MLELKGLEPLDAALAGKKLGDASLPQDAIEKKLAKDWQKEAGEATFTASAEAEAGIAIINSADDVTPEQEGGENPFLLISTDKEAPVAFNDQSAWLNYSFGAQVKGKANLKLKDYGFGFSGQSSHKVNFSSLRIHDRNQEVGPALVADLSSFQNLLDINSIKNLKQGEALGMEVEGSLGAKITLKWSDVFTSTAQGIASLLNIDYEVFAIKTEASASASFNVEINDRFTLVFSYHDATTVKVSVHKSKTSKKNLNLAADITAGFDSSAAVNQVLDKAMTGLLGKAEGKIKDLIQQANGKLDNLDDNDRQTLENVMERLGLPDEDEQIQFVEGKIDDLTLKAKDKIIDLANAKVKFGAAYEYSRTENSKELFVATLSHEALQQYHLDFVKFNLKKVLENIREGQANGLTLLDYLKQKEIVRKSAFGFTLGVGPWEFSGKDEVKRVFKETINKEQKQMLAFLGSRLYTGKWMGNEVNWTVDFDAQMDQFSQGYVPKTSEFGFGIDLSFTWTDKTFDDQELAVIVDHAVLWKVVPQGQASKVIDEIKAAAEGQNASITCRINLDKEAFGTILPKLSYLAEKQQDKALIGQSLGAAMSYLNDFELRKTVKGRKENYGKLWAAYMGMPASDAQRYRELSQMAFRELRGEDLNLARHEKLGRNDGHTPGNNWFWQTAYTNPKTQSNWQFLGKGIVKLYAGISQGLPYNQVVDQAFKNMTAFWEQSHHVRAFGHYLLENAASYPHLDGVSSVLTVDYKDGHGKNQSLTIASKKH